MKPANKFFQGMAHHPSGMIAGVFIAALVLIALTVGFFPSLDPHVISNDSFVAPSAEFLIGSDELGRSVAAGVLHGARVSLTVGFFAALMATGLGILIGSAAGFYGGWFDVVVMRVSEFFQVIPSFILAAVIVAMTGTGLPQIIAVVGMLAWPQVARVMRGEVMRVKELEFVDAVRCLGMSERRVLFGEVIPNAVAPVLAVGTLIIGQAILLEASLSFLGLSSAELVSWGRMLNSGQRFLFNAWWLSFFPGMAIFITVLAFNLFGDAVAAVLNPRNAR
ncbi:ABC transporter permease [Ottowia thiooxydans]|uniref:Peptide/nickel transport system permease protein n=1 Tax=Ottowia thiooxydans TaxID=219182 RepID=A0ABV2QG43_9BURK